MPKASVKRLIECKKEDLIKLVLDIEKYPEFVPFCFDAKVYENKNEGHLTKIIADLTVGKKYLNQTYKSHVTFYKDKDKIIVNNIGGPLKHLKNEWEIRDINGQSEVNFVIDFEIKNVFYNMIMKKSFDQGISSIADAFEKRAIYLFKNT